MNLNGKRVLIAGGAGAIGNNLIRELLEKYNCDIVVVDDLSSGHNSLRDIKDKIEFYHTSILNDDMLEKIFDKRIDIVFHLAALFANQKSVDQPKEDLLVNGLGTLKLLQYSQKNRVGKFIFTSSSCIYGGKAVENSEDSVDFSLDTPYSITKLFGEKYCEYFYEQYSLPVVILRIFNTYGPGEYPGKYRNVIPNFIYRALRGEQLTITGTGEETRDYTFMDDTVQAIVKAAEVNGAVGEIFNIGCGEEIKIIDLAKKINALCGNDKDILFVPQRDWDSVMRRKANIEKAKRILGYNPRYNIDEGLKITYDWLKAELNKNKYTNAF
jgi:nucleoside-diphosphate-sugar epimerase